MGNCNACLSEEECPMCRREVEKKAYTNPYIWFYLDVYKELAPKTVKEIGTEAGRRWRTMTKAEKEPYMQIAKQKREFYMSQIKSRNNLKTVGSKLNKPYGAIKLRKRRHGKPLRKQAPKQKLPNPER